MAEGTRLRAATGVGQLLAGAARVVALRPAAKPLHPRGTTWSAALLRQGGSRTGVPWIDEPGTDSATFRRSRAVGLPEGWPDVHGLAIRSESAGGAVADVLLATTGSGPLGRFMLHAGRRPESMFFGGLLPYRSTAGPIVLGAVPRDDGLWDLLWAVGRAPWTPFARLAPWQRIPDTDISFDPVLNRPEGLEQYDALARLRLPAYRTARRTRDDSIAMPVAGTRTP